MPKITRPLTNTEVEKAKPQAKEYTLTDGYGLFLLILPSGIKSWRFNYARPITQKRTKISLGIYPAVSLAQARAKREEYRALLAQGIDPQEHKEQEQKAAITKIENSLLFIAERWKAKKAQEVEALTLKKNWRRMETYLFSSMGNMPINEIVPKIAIEALEPLYNQGKGDTLRRVIRLLNEVLNFAVNYGLIPFNPCLQINEVFSFGKSNNNPAISPKELPELIKTVMYSSVAIQTKLLFQFQLLTMVRPSEASNATWSEIDLEKALWTIPAKRMKKRNPFVIPLSSQAIAILDKMKSISPKSEYVFQSWIKSNQPMSSQTINKMLSDLGYKDKQTAHGLRTIGRTYLAEQRIDYEVAEMCISHKTGTQTGKIYDRADFLEQRKPVMQLWGDYVEKCSPK
ncbi:TPA: tyrosine-type recombinase/integrase [Pasteurella multocida]|uniref:tyrosine-type recombinase/integrase n=1 Tax=Pasteurella multocida TaxID=747 RepID=UPI0020205EFD|nr:integrase arm-type DNA-binding domain-containing protein [Pasteurella multocida]MCL7758949.1 tyrosine-type recombinase/integrase [Pasteurella multocida]MDG2542088.1 tyrosine-type recombinase/integrase [Pasteurella multocida]HDR1927886.1 tyrosine-type recombinase/integrase [Pasteurella multocida]HED4412903.1 tyrosine-type recombinase/integrase [Pasteurella multocida]HED4453673.1 tyrosine-type recombinase/integrase [Pasteurella multocida]